MNIEYTQRYDEEGFEVQAGEIHLIECCDCGLVHDFVFVSEDGKPIGVAARRNESQTAERRALRIQRPPMLNEAQTKQLIGKFMRTTNGGRTNTREGIREIINLVYAQGHRSGRVYAAKSEAGAQAALPAQGHDKGGEA